MRGLMGFLAGVLVVLVSQPVLGEGSLGTGGVTGERTDWPCSQCIMNTPPGYDPATPTPLLVTFHGDEGDPDYIHWKLADDVSDAGFLMLSLKCPNELGCNQVGGSWWQWEAYVNEHDPSWAGSQVDAVQAEYNVELQRVYLAGFSGGASYLSWYARDFSDRYAAAVYFGGGYAPWDGQCNEPCAIPINFLIGSQDFLLDGAQELRDYYMGCGNDVSYTEVAGVDHQIISSGVPDVMTWLGAQSHICRPEPPPPDPDPEPGCTSAPDCNACNGCMALCLCETGDANTCQAECNGDPPIDGDPPAGGPPGETTPSGDDDSPLGGGCACEAAGGTGNERGGWLALGLLGFALGRRERKR